MRVFLISIGALLVAVVPVQAQLFRRPVVQQIIHSPVTNDLANFALQHFLPGFPQLPNLPTISGSSPSLSVDASVKVNLDAVDTNLASAGDILKTLSAKTAQTDSTKKASKKNKEAPKVSPEAERIPAPSDSKPADDIERLTGLLRKATDEKQASVLRQQLQQKLKQAEDKFKKSSELDALLAKAKTLLDQGNAKQAVDAFKSVMEKDPTSALAKEGLREALMMQRESDLIDSIREITAEIKNLKKPEGLRLNLASSAISIKKNDKTTIKLVLSANAPANLTATASATNIDSTVLTGTGTVAMGSKTLDLTIATTKDVPASVSEIIVSLTGAPQANGILLRLPVKIEP